MGLLPRSRVQMPTNIHSMQSNRIRATCPPHRRCYPRDLPRLPRLAAGLAVGANDLLVFGDMPTLSFFGQSEQNQKALRMTPRHQSYTVIHRFTCAPRFKFQFHPAPKP